MKFKFKLWIEDDEGRPIIGKGGYKLLNLIREKGSIAEASREMGVSYKFAWDYVKRVSDALGGVELRKGGKGAGGTKLDENLLKVLEIYERAMREVEQVLERYNKELNEVLKQKG